MGPAGVWVQVQQRPTGDAKGTGEVSLVSLAGSMDKLNGCFYHAPWMRSFKEWQVIWRTGLRDWGLNPNFSSNVTL